MMDKEEFEIDSARRERERFLDRVALIAMRSELYASAIVESSTEIDTDALAAWSYKVARSMLAARRGNGE